MFFISCFRIISDTSSPFSDVRQQKSCRLPSVSLSLKSKQLVCLCHQVPLGQSNCFYSTPFRGRVYKWKICLFICLSVITSYSFPSDSKLRRVTQPLPRYPMSPSMSPMPPPPHSPVNWSPLPVNWSPNEQDHLADLF